MAVRIFCEVSAASRSKQLEQSSVPGIPLQAVWCPVSMDYCWILRARLVVEQSRSLQQFGDLGSAEWYHSNAGSPIRLSWQYTNDRWSSSSIASFDLPDLTSSLRIWSRLPINSNSICPCWKRRTTFSAMPSMLSWRWRPPSKSYTIVPISFISIRFGVNRVGATNCWIASRRSISKVSQAVSVSIEVIASVRS